MKHLNVVLSVACGLLGGILSHYAWTLPVHAQTVASTPKEVRSQSFVLVDAKDHVQGVFSVDEPQSGPAIIRLVDRNGHEIWKAGGNGLQPLGGSINHK